MNFQITILIFDRSERQMDGQAQSNMCILFKVGGIRNHSKFIVCED